MSSCRVCCLFPVLFASENNTRYSGGIVCLQNILASPRSCFPASIPSSFPLLLPFLPQVDGLDVVVGGHTNTFLWTEGASPSKKDPLESPSGPYPTVVEQDGGRKVLVVQTSGYGKYLGRLKVTFDDRTEEVTRFSGSPVLLDSSVPKDPEVERQVRAYAEKVSAKMEVVVGRSSQFIDGGRPKCRLEECGFGNLVTDAMAEEMGVDIAVVNSGAIKGSFSKGQQKLLN